ncbi:MAG: DUF3179 domain-containing protein [Kiloniellales bacterium]
MRGTARVWIGGLVALLLASGTTAAASDDAPASWRAEWPSTDFSQHAVDLDEIRSGGPPKDGIPSIDDPVFATVAEMQSLAPREPVIGLVVNGDARAYPLQVLIWHEIVNDTVGGVPVAVTYCPLCNSAIVFDRRLDDRVLDFGTTGKLRHSDLVMYDRTTESWWQQFLGEAIVGELTGARLAMLPSRIEGWERFAVRHPTGRVLLPGNPEMRPYGRNPYAGYDSAPRPFLYDGSVPEGIAPLAYVVAVGDQAWPLDLLREKEELRDGDLVLRWEPGATSALDHNVIAEGRDIGNVTVQRQGADGPVDVVYDLTFAFVFHAFRPEGRIHQ